MLGKVRIGALLAQLVGLGGQPENSPANFPQGGSTITQQLVRGHFLQSLTVFQNLTARENSTQLRQGVLLPRLLSWLIGGRSANMVVRKLEEIRLSLWVETAMQARFGSKRRAKEEILARYASFIYMGNGQYGFARAAEYYFGRPSPRSPWRMRTRQRCWQASQSRLVTTRPVRRTLGESFADETRPCR